MCKIAIIFDDVLCRSNMNDPWILKLFQYGRHFQLGIWVISQSLRQLAPDIRRNIQMYVLFRMINESDREWLANNILQSYMTKKEALLLNDSLPRFHSLIVDFENNNLYLFCAHKKFLKI